MTKPPTSYLRRARTLIWDRTRNRTQLRLRGIYRGSSSHCETWARERSPGTGTFRWMQSSGTTMMQASCCRVEHFGWRADRNWPLILALVCVTALLQVELSRGAIGSCKPDNTCELPTNCCSKNLFCGNTPDYCGVGNCVGGPCAQVFNTTVINGKKSQSAGTAVGIAVGVVAGLGLIILGACLFVACRRRAHHKGNEFSKTRFTAQGLEAGMDTKPRDSAYNREVRVASTISGVSNSALSIQSAELRGRLSYETLYSATDGFSVELGRGAFGVVYKGTLRDGTDIAVKQLLDGHRDVQDFEAEVKTLGRINHANLVALLAFTFENNNFFLVYEFVANGSLDRWIFKDVKADPEFVLPWNKRVDILKGTAKGLAYMHEELQRGQMIVHLDIKPQNILLDMLYAPKIADFGLAKLLGSATTKQTLAAGGTKGYMAPEVYVAAVSQKMDVYSFGIVMLEVVSGRHHEDHDLAPDTVFLPAWAIRKVLAGEEVDVVDHLFQENQFDTNEAKRLIWIALLCLQGDPTERPGMSTVFRMMEANVDPPDLPTTLQAELEKAEKLIRGRLAGEVSSSREASDNMIKFSGDTSRSGSREPKGRRPRGIDSDEKPLFRA